MDRNHIKMVLKTIDEHLRNDSDLSPLTEDALNLASDLIRDLRTECDNQEALILRDAAFDLVEAVECSIDLDLHPLLKRRLDAAKAAIKEAR